MRDCFLFAEKNQIAYKHLKYTPHLSTSNINE